MQKRVIGPVLANYQVAGGVVSLVLIDVMDLRAGWQRSAKRHFCRVDVRSDVALAIRLWV
jgi:hypothetical protein